MANRVLVCGGRDFNDSERVAEILDSLTRPVVIIDGGATGADHEARMWATRNRLPVETYRAHWKDHGRAAGPIRNQRMIDEGKPSIVIAFPGGRGTADMVRRAERAGVAVIEVPARPLPNDVEA
ncbi:DUF2493 domain-containing protein [Sphingomonas japonica]|uniref:Aspartokinase-like uncharacterized kinase n=1 Tax=Sphingomonas japonica TaxID=511662 RepID=A0ABX0U2P8_9SPHN|nr:DUF2493 domain-containing protein [Sphingomonas japonica]NIJ24856.1 aspartokinase-like uncharacterized kinase [Sphingomonas japonica]